MTVADSVRVDEAGGRDHQVTPSDAEAHLDGGALDTIAAGSLGEWLERARSAFAGKKAGDGG